MVNITGRHTGSVRDLHNIVQLAVTQFSRHRTLDSAPCSEIFAVLWKDQTKTTKKTFKQNYTRVSSYKLRWCCGGVVEMLLKCCWNAVEMLLWCCCDAFLMLWWLLVSLKYGTPASYQPGEADLHRRGVQVMLCVLSWCCCFLPCNSTSIKKTVIRRSKSISIICEYQENRKKHVIYKAAASSSLPSPVREGSPLRCTGWQTGSISSWEISSKLCQVCCVTMYDRLNS